MQIPSVMVRLQSKALMNMYFYAICVLTGVGETPGGRFSRTATEEF